MPAVPKAVKFMRDDLTIEGVSGPVKFSGNDKPGWLGLWQLSGSQRVPVGTVDENGTTVTGWSEGLRNETWLPPYPPTKPPPFPWRYVIAPVVVFFICCPICMGLGAARYGNIFERILELRRQDKDKTQQRQDIFAMGAMGDQDQESPGALPEAA